MDELGYALDVITPWLERYHASGPRALSHRETVAVGVWLLDADVNNDGFGQYYANSAGVLAHATVDAPREIGARETASMLETANKDVPILSLPADSGERDALLESISEQTLFGALEREYYEEREGRMGLLAHYLRRTEPGGR